jgi:hypothetical protein
MVGDLIMLFAVIVAVSSVYSFVVMPLWIVYRGDRFEDDDGH